MARLVCRTFLIVKGSNLCSSDCPCCSLHGSFDGQAPKILLGKVSKALPSFHDSKADLSTTDKIVRIHGHAARQHGFLTRPTWLTMECGWVTDATPSSTNQTEDGQGNLGISIRNSHIWTGGPQTTSVPGKTRRDQAKQNMG